MYLHRSITRRLQWLVAAGTLMAVALSQTLGWLDAARVARIEALFARAGLPVFGPELGVERYLGLMANDKKVEDARLRLILLRDIGHGVVEAGASRQQIADAIAGRQRAS